jgi:hypothetical protein
MRIQAVDGKFAEILTSSEKTTDAEWLITYLKSLGGRSFTLSFSGIKPAGQGIVDFDCQSLELQSFLLDTVRHINNLEFGTGLWPAIINLKSLTEKGAVIGNFKLLHAVIFMSILDKFVRYQEELIKRGMKIDLGKRPENFLNLLDTIEKCKISDNITFGDLYSLIGMWMDVHFGKPQGYREGSGPEEPIDIKEKSQLAKANLVNIFGLKPDASPEEIKNAYKEYIKKYHPDALVTASAAEQKEGEQKVQVVTELMSEARKTEPEL